MRYVDSDEQTQNIISVCTGIGGIERGLKRAGLPLRTVCYVEIEAFICENLACSMEAGVLAETPIWTNLKTFRTEDFCGKVHGITGGYPCQPFSMAGNRKGTDDPRHLWPYIESAFGTIRPVWGLFENVTGHLSMGFDQVSASLRRMGYRVEAGIYSAEEVGAPQERDRLFFLAILENSDGLRLWWERTGRFQYETFRAGEKLGYAGYESLERSGIGGRSDSEGWETQDGSACEPSEVSELGSSESFDKWNDRANDGEFGQQDRRSGNELADASFDIMEKWNIQPRIRAEFGRNGEELADSLCDSEREVQTEKGGSSFGSESFIYGDSGRTFRFPAGQGELQYGWEEPRTIGGGNRLPNSVRKLWKGIRKSVEKAMGEEAWKKAFHGLKTASEPCLEFTANGYGFMEDLHRAIGNSVVEQTAELAFLDLLRKHYDTK